MSDTFSREYDRPIHVQTGTVIRFPGDVLNLARVTHESVYTMTWEIELTGHTKLTGNSIDSLERALSELRDKPLGIYFLGLMTPASTNGSVSIRLDTHSQYLSVSGIDLNWVAGTHARIDEELRHLPISRWRAGGLSTATWIAVSAAIVTWLAVLGLAALFRFDWYLAPALGSVPAGVVSYLVGTRMSRRPTLIFQTDSPSPKWHQRPMFDGFKATAPVIGTIAGSMAILGAVLAAAQRCSPSP